MAEPDRPMTAGEIIDAMEALSMEMESYFEIGAPVGTATRKWAEAAIRMAKLQVELAKELAHGSGDV